MRLIAATLCCLTSSLATAAQPAEPVRLTCKWNNGARMVTHEWTLREREGNADLYVLDTGAARSKVAAVFSTTKVVLDRDDAGAEYVIDRTTMDYSLTFKRPFRYFTGKCAFAKPPARRF